MAVKRQRVVIHGRVQGVWFRAWTVESALQRGLAGWVRNRRDGTVEAAFEGEAAHVDDMVAACWQGPPLADVIRIESFDCDEPLGPGFDARPSA